MNRYLSLTTLILIVTAFNLLAQPAELNALFDFSQYRAQKFPRHVTTIAILRQEGKARPLFLYGRNQSGTLRLTLDDAQGTSAEVTVSASGKAKVELNRYSITPALDAPFTVGAPWLNMDPLPPLTLTIEQLTDWKQIEGDPAPLIRPDPSARKSKKKKKAPFATFETQASLQIDVAESTQTVTMPLTVRIENRGAYYTITLTGQHSIPAKSLGLDGPPIRFFWTTSAYSPPPRAQSAPKPSSP